MVYDNDVTNVLLFYNLYFIQLKYDKMITKIKMRPYIIRVNSQRKKKKDK